MCEDILFMNIFLLQYSTWQVAREVRTFTTSLGNSLYAKKKKQQRSRFHVWPWTPVVNLILLSKALNISSYLKY
jgi:hypothetical protein